MDISRLVRFLRQLKANNNKQWFDAHREEYQELRVEFSDFVQQVITLIAKFDPALKHVTAKEGMYRINRDIRFSHNKTPYKTNFGAGIEPGGRKGEMPGYHLHIDATGQVMVAGGLYMMTPQQLNAVRDSIDRQPGQLRKIIEAPQFRKTFGGLAVDDQLKRPPRGFSADHPDIDLLKLKRFVAWTEWPVKQSSASGLAQEVAKKAEALYPLDVYLRHVV